MIISFERKNTPANLPSSGMSGFVFAHNMPATRGYHRQSHLQKSRSQIGQMNVIRCNLFYLDKNSFQEAFVEPTFYDYVGFPPVHSKPTLCILGWEKARHAHPNYVPHVWYFHFFYRFALSVLSASKTRAQLRVPLWKLSRSYFSLGL